MSDPHATASFAPTDAPSIGDAATMSGSGVPADGDAATLSVPVAPPGYVVEGELGRGGMGVVYKARQVALDRPVALKIVLGGGHASAAARARFLAEAKAAAAVRHPGIAQVYDLGEHAGLPFFAMEFCPGGSLADKLAGTPLPPRDAAALVAAIADAVQAAHAAGIVHRDLKPANILLSVASGPSPVVAAASSSSPKGGGGSSGASAGRQQQLATGHWQLAPKVSDFGLARHADSSSGLTATGAVLGSPSYMPPEQAAGSRDVGPAADVYGLGAILYECLTGRPPFRAATALETVAQVLKDDPAPPSALVPRLPRDLETVCLKCLRKDARKRYGSAAELADDLRRFLDGKPVAARPAGTLERMWKAAKRRPALTGSVGVVTLAVAAVVGVVVWKNGQLLQERNAAKASEASAEAARQSAEGRLVLALDAVEKMMVRMAGERWARNPALRDERRAVFAEAIGLFRSLPASETADPRVRRRVAATEARIGQAHLALAEYDKAAAALGTAAAIQEELHRAAPTAATAAEFAQTLVYVGHVHLLRSQFPEGVAAYERAATLAREARALDPGRPDSWLVLAEALTALGQSNTGRGDASQKLYAEVMELTRDMARDPTQYGGSLFCAIALVNMAAEASRNKPGAGGAILTSGEMLLGLLKDRPAPTARWADLYDSTRAGALLQRALLTPRDPAAALKLVDEALAVVESLLAVEPKMFPYLMHKLNALAIRADVLSRLNREAEAGKALAEVSALTDRMVAENPSMVWIRPRFALQQSLDLVHKVRAGDVANLDGRVAALRALLPPKRAATAQQNAAADTIRYNIACAFAQAARFGTADEKEARAKKAVAELTAIPRDGLFSLPGRDTLPVTDTDLDPLRGRPDFEAFLKSIAK